MGRKKRDVSKAGTKFDNGKLRFSLIPEGVEETLVKVLMEGAATYGDNNWQLVEEARERYYNALRRHLDAWFYKGQIIDPASGLHNMGHILANAAFLLWFDKNQSL